LVPNGKHSDQHRCFMQEEVHVEPEADLGQDSALNQASPGLQQGATPSDIAPVSSAPISDERASDAEPVRPEQVDADNAGVIDQPQVVTRSKHGISKPKVYTDGTIIYNFHVSASEPGSLREALQD
jgi:hypothetical protein